MIVKLKSAYKQFLESEKSGGLLLIACTFFSLVLANTILSANYSHLWHYPIAGQPAEHWINDGLMAVFFLLIGLELEREIYIGKLSDLKKASLPLFAAMGGMIVPATLFLLFNYGKPTQDGAGIPMATDIAFAIGILTLLGNKVPPSLRTILTALAVIDDLGAIIIIAVFYTSTLSVLYLSLALGVFIFLIILNRMKVHHLLPYIIGGIIMWYFMLQSGVHATITGVMLAFAIPFGDGGKKSPSVILEHLLHKPVVFIILPLFALANTCISIHPNWHQELLMPNSIGILAGLVIGKPLGIFLFSFLAVTTGVCALPHDLNWKHIIGIGFLGGIGFTMSIFITLLAFDNDILITESKIAVLIASLVSGALGFFWLKKSLSERQSVR